MKRFSFFRPLTFSQPRYKNVKRRIVFLLYLRFQLQRLNYGKPF